VTACLAADDLLGAVPEDHSIEQRLDDIAVFVGSEVRRKARRVRVSQRWRRAI
jgi:hypothetical protein